MLSIAAGILSGSKTGGFLSKLTALSQWVKKTLCNTLHSFKEGYARRMASDVTGTMTVEGSKLQQRAKADEQVSSGLGGKVQKHGKGNWSITELKQDLFYISP